MDRRYKTLSEQEKKDIENNFVGKKFGDVKDLYDWIRVTRVNEQGRLGTCDVQPNRLNVHIENAPLVETREHEYKSLGKIKVHIYNENEGTVLRVYWG